MSRYIDADKACLQCIAHHMCNEENCIVAQQPTADVVSREQYNTLYEENLKLREELNNLAGEELPWAIVTIRPRNKGETPYRYHCPHCGYSHKKASHYCSNCGRRCKC